MSKLPPPLYAASDGQEHWFATLFANSSTLQITQPNKNEITKRYPENAGMLEFMPPLQGIGRVRYGSWNIAARKVETVMDGKAQTLGWVLVVNITDRNKKQHSIDFAFQSRHKGPSVRNWVTMVNRRLNRTLAKAAPR